MISLIIADDHEVVRSGMASLLAGSGIEIVGMAATGRDAVELAEQTQPDVALMDIRMPDMDGLAALEQIRSKVPNTKVVMMSTYDNPTYIARAMALGACDYLLRGASRKNIIEAIEAAVAGKPPSGAFRRAAGALKSRPVVDDEVPLTSRETQVLRHVALGLTNKEIARSLGISVETVKEHLQNILRKIAVNDRTQAAVWAVRKGLV